LKTKTKSVQSKTGLASWNAESLLESIFNYKKQTKELLPVAEPKKRLGVVSASARQAIFFVFFFYGDQQGDQIGRIFAQWADCLLWAVNYNGRRCKYPTFGILHSTVNFMY
jgi:hypothetical protein